MGIIALDIDGTVTDSSHQIPPKVDAFLAKLAETWQIIFITGRTFPYGQQTLFSCSFPYDYAVYNGAVTFHMPDKQIIRRHYLDPAVLPLLDEIGKEEGIDYVLSMGGDAEECAIYRRDHFSQEELEYFEVRKKAGGEPWTPVESFDNVKQNGLCYAKLFGKTEKLKRIGKEMETAARVATSLVHDPLRDNSSVLLITNPTATKGAALREYAQSHSPPVIAAGDDYNDLTMLREADIAIAMETAPREVKEIADIIAPPSNECGIIDGLERGIGKATDEHR